MGSIYCICSSGNFICREMFWSFSPTNLGQIWKPMTVLESARPEDSETPPESWIWWRFGWDIEGLPQVMSCLNFPVPKLEVRAKIRVVFYLQYLSQIFIKFNFQGVFQNPQDVQISKLSLVFKIDQDLWEKKTKTFRDNWNFHYCMRIHQTHCWLSMSTGRTQQLNLWRL